jgi:DNA end-binding protein Ku
MLHYAYYANEVRSFDEVDTGATVTFKPVEAELADKLIEQLTIPEFNADAYRDEYVERVKQAVEQKVAGQEVAVAPEQPTAQIIDLFEALKRSLKEEAPAEAIPPKKAMPRKPSRAKTETG